MEALKTLRGTPASGFSAITSIPHAQLERIFRMLVRWFVVITVLLPTSSVFGINFKYPLYACLLPLAVYRSFRARRNQVIDFLLLSGVPVVLTLWVVLGAENNFPLAGAVRQYTDIILTVILCWLASLFYAEQESGRLNFIRLVIGSAVATSSLKLILIAYALTRGIPVAQVIDSFSKFFGTTLMTMDLGSLLGRVQFLSDVILPVCVYMLLRYREQLHFSILRASITSVLLLSSVLLSFSRYFWGFAAFAFVLGLIRGKQDRFQVALAVILMAVSLTSLPALITLYQLRFSVDVAGGSDAQRIDQTNGLQELFWQAPVFGNGLGSYTRKVIRSADTETTRFGYEMQLLALTAQVGVVGISFFIVLLGWYYRRLLLAGTLNMPDRLALLSLLLFWLLAGVYNPLLINLPAGVTFAVIGAATGIRSDSY